MTCYPVHSPAKEGSLLVLAVLALVVGAAAGLVGALFRLTLAQADQLRNILIGWAHGHAAVDIPGFCDHMWYGNVPCCVAGPAVLTASIGQWNSAC